MSKKTDPVMTFDDVAKKTEQFGDLLGSIESLEDKKKHLWSCQNKNLLDESRSRNSAKKRFPMSKLGFEHSFCSIELIFGLQ